MLTRCLATALPAPANEWTVLPIINGLEAVAVTCGDGLSGIERTVDTRLAGREGRPSDTDRCVVVLGEPSDAALVVFDVRGGVVLLVVTKARTKKQLEPPAQAVAVSVLPCMFCAASVAF